MRDSEQDYELLVLAKSRGHGAQALGDRAQRVPAQRSGNGTPQALEDARQKLAALIGK